VFLMHAGRVKNVGDRRLAVCQSFSSQRRRSSNAQATVCLGVYDLMRPLYEVNNNIRALQESFIRQSNLKTETLWPTLALAGSARVVSLIRPSLVS